MPVEVHSGWLSLFCEERPEDSLHGLIVQFVSPRRWGTSGDQDDADGVPGAVAQAVKGLVHLIQGKTVRHRPGEVELP